MEKPPGKLGLLSLLVSLAIIALGVGTFFVVLSPPSWLTQIINQDEPGYQPTKGDLLVDAVWDRDLDSAKQLIAKGASVDYLADNGDSRKPIAIAIQNADVPMVELLLNAGASFTEDNFGQRVFYYVGNKRNEEILTTVLRGIEDINQIYTGGRSALGEAVECNWPLMVEALLNKGADPDSYFENQKDNCSCGSCFYNATAMTLAIKGQNTGIIAQLLEAGADVNRVNEDGYSPLLMACRHEAEAGVFQLLIDAGADVNFREECNMKKHGPADHPRHGEERYGRFALHYAAWFADESVYRSLIEAGAGLESRDWLEATPLHEAAELSNTAGVKLLLAAGADPNAFRSGEQFALHLAAKAGSTQNIKQLVRSGADVNCQSMHGRTPLRYASAGCGGVDVVEYLIAHGADPLVADEDGVTPLQAAQERTITEGHLCDRSIHHCTFEYLTTNREQIIEVLLEYEL